MDRSLLCQPEVIAAARAWVSARLATYENASEAAFLASFGASRSGELENSVFVLLAPDGQQRLTRPARSPDRVYGTAAEMAAGLVRLAAPYPARPGSPGELPKAASVRLGLDVAACDSQPLAVLLAADAPALARLERRLVGLAWSERFAGKLVWAAASALDQAKAIEGAKSGLLVVQPDRFGLSGKVLVRSAPEAPEAELAQTLEYGLSLHKREERTFQGQLRDGHRLGIFWETPVPVTDPQERQARERARRPR